MSVSVQVSFKIFGQDYTVAQKFTIYVPPKDSLLVYYTLDNQNVSTSLSGIPNNVSLTLGGLEGEYASWFDLEENSNDDWTFSAIQPAAGSYSIFSTSQISHIVWDIQQTYDCQLQHCSVVVDNRSSFEYPIHFHTRVLHTIL
jgi:hypothetical protein